MFGVLNWRSAAHTLIFSVAIIFISGSCTEFVDSLADGALGVGKLDLFINRLVK
jgi:hypothetical protein